MNKILFTIIVFLIFISGSSALEFDYNYNNLYNSGEREFGITYYNNNTTPRFITLNSEPVSYNNNSEPVSYNNNIENGTRPYQISLTLSNEDGVSDSTHLYGNGRFIFNTINSTNINTNINITGNNETLLPMWFETITDNQTALVWVNVTQNFTGVQINVGVPNYIYNNSMGGTNTFLFFDDFSGNLSRWTIRGNMAIVDGELNMPSNTLTDSTPTFSNAAFGTTYVYEAKFKTISGNRIQPSPAYISDGGAGTTTMIRYISFLDVANQIYETDVWGVNNVVGIKSTYDGAWHKWTVWREPTAVTLFVDDTPVGTRISVNAVYNTSTKIGLSQYNTNARVDDVRVRKYASPEPAWGATWSGQHQYISIFLNNLYSRRVNINTENLFIIEPGTTYKFDFDAALAVKWFEWQVIDNDETLIDLGYIIILFLLWYVIFFLKQYKIAQTINALSYTLSLLLYQTEMVTLLTINIVLMLNFMVIGLIMITSTANDRNLK